MMNKTSRLGTPPGAGPDFRHVETWVFDLDNTLYPAHCNLFAHIDRNIRGFISQFLDVGEDEAHRLQKQYYREHGTTLAGLMKEHAMDPQAFLDTVHEIDLAPIEADPALAAALDALPGRKIVYTNGTVAHAERVMAKLGIEHHFEGVFDIVHADYVPKPQGAAFARFIDRHGVEPTRAAMFEDLARNLVPARALGMTTVLVLPKGGHADPEVRDWTLDETTARSVDHRTEDLTHFLTTLVAERRP
jgi:putative hydrolase of the HAD superfamily